MRRATPDIFLSHSSPYILRQSLSLTWLLYLAGNPPLSAGITHARTRALEIQTQVPLLSQKVAYEPSQLPVLAYRVFTRLVSLGFRVLEFLMCFYQCLAWHLPVSPIGSHSWPGAFSRCCFHPAQVLLSMQPRSHFAFVAGLFGARSKTDSALLDGLF